MNLFPRRQSQDEWLNYYDSLKHDEKDEGEDLFGEEHDDKNYEEESGEEGGEESGEEASAQAEGEEEDDEEQEEAAHKAFDAALRQEEEAGLQALARRFEERAASEAFLYEDDEPSLVHQAMRTAKLAAEKAAEKAAAEHMLAEANERAQADERAKRKRDALYLLFDLESEAAEGREGEATVPTLVPAADCKRKCARGESSAAAIAGRYRIKKKTPY